ncbi:MAG: BNR-4 repeat-containing protein [Alphaproteobacteria bacterium]|nr:BNR-4 repeat-containing protein [Alphaproteobacteria bacterium]
MKLFDKLLHKQDFDFIYNRYISEFVDMPKKIEIYQRQKNKTNKIVIYTALVNHYDSIKIPQILHPNIDYICFTNQPIKDTGVWQIMACPWLDADSTRTARYIKTHPHYLLPEYEIAIWLDSNLLICGDIFPYIEKFLTSDCAVGAVWHPQRQNIYQEVKACDELKKDNADIMYAQVEIYRQEGFEHNDLIESNFMMFKLTNPKVPFFLNMWWSQIESFSRRDQLSLNYCLQKCGLNWHPLFPKNICCRNNADILYFPHDQNQGTLADLPNLLIGKKTEPYNTVPYSQIKDERLSAVKDKTIDVVICVHNALEDVQKCLDSVIRWRAEKERIIIIDDGSDEQTVTYLADIAQKHNLHLIRHEKPLGYTKSANQGFQHSNSDLVILLNSDTIVTKDWALKMADAVFSAKGAGVVGVMSNAAGNQSLPNIIGKNGQTAVNIIPKELSPDMINAFCEQWSDANVGLRVPMVHGFCFGVTRECLNALHGFDEEHFPTGFGEEDDFSFRASNAGFSLVLATNTFIFHAKTKSFSSQKRLQLCAQGRQNLIKLHRIERCNNSSASMQQNPVLQELRRKAEVLFSLYPKTTQDDVENNINFNLKHSFSFCLGKGFAANAINTLPFRHNAITSYMRYGKKIQYCVWYGESGQIMAAKRKGNIWKSTVTQFKNDMADAHNIVVMTADGAGYLHLIWSKHNGNLAYARSVKPHKLKFEQASLIGTMEEKATYPELFTLPSGDILLLYRCGQSGNGQLVLNKYKHKQKTWVRVADCLIDGVGEESPYWQACVDHKGRLHISWCWRKNADVTSNHDIFYMRSTDENCRQFTDIDNNILPLPQTPKNTLPIYAIAQGNSLINQTSMTVDEKNNPYILTYFQHQGVLQYMLLCVQNKQWQIIDTQIRHGNESLTGLGTKQLPCARPKILVYHHFGRRKILLLLRDSEFGGKIVLVRLKIKGSQITSGYTMISLDDVGEWEPMLDEMLWQKKKKLSILAQYTAYKQDVEPIQNLLASNIYAVDIKI